jgi:hypothetical protein
MAKRSVRRTVRSIDPLFFIPDGVDELFYDEDASDSIHYAEGTQEEDGIIFESEGAVVVEPPTTDEPLPGNTTGRPPAPQILGIVRQITRILSNGDERVDVVLKVEDIPGADKYEFRISKT